MKRYTYSAIILLAAIALAGCSKTEEFQYNPDSALHIESVSGISPFALMQEPASKAVISGETLPGDEAAKGIGLFVTAQGGGAYDGKTTGYSNVKYAYSSEKWSAASPIYLSNTTGKLYAYFPYSADATDLTAIPVESSLNGTDYLYATSQDVSFSNKSVNLQMNHALARLNLTIKKGDKYLSDCNLTKIVLQSKAIDATGTMDITTGAVTPAKGADETGVLTLTGDDVSRAITAAGIVKDILLVPASNAEGKKDLILTLTIDGVDAIVNFKSDSGLDIRSGIQCNVTLTIESTGIKVEGIGVGVWGSGGSQTVEVQGHKVAIKYSNETGVEDDVYLKATSNGSTVTIKSLAALTGRRTNCTFTPAGKATCSSSIDATTGICTFTITDVQDDITAEVGYLKYNATVAYDSNMGAVKLNGAPVTSETPVQILHGEKAEFTAEAATGNGFVKWTDSSDEDLSTDNPYTISSVTSNITLNAVFGYEISAEVKPAGVVGTVTGAGIYAEGSTATLTAIAGGSGTEFVGWAKSDSPGTIISADNPYEFTVSQSASYVAVFKLLDALSGVFTVAADEQGKPTKKVQFSKGNLYCSGVEFYTDKDADNYGTVKSMTNAQWGFESNQYDTTPTTNNDRTDGHISHFLWCDSAANAMALKYKDGWNGTDKSFFAAKNFTVNGYSGWSVLTGGENGEWRYLLSSRKTVYGDNRRYAAVKVNGMAGLLIFPDDFSSWPSKDAGTEPQTFNTYSDNWNGKNYSAAEFAVLQNKGCVFLPAAGYRDGSNRDPHFIFKAGSEGYYWSASSNFDNYAYVLNFLIGSVSLRSSGPRNWARSVRLVTECQSEPSAE